MPCGAVRTNIHVGARRQVRVETKASCARALPGAGRVPPPVRPVPAAASPVPGCATVRVGNCRPAAVPSSRADSMPASHPATHQSRSYPCALGDGRRAPPAHRGSLAVPGNDRARGRAPSMLHWRRRDPAASAQVSAALRTRSALVLGDQRDFQFQAQRPGPVIIRKRAAVILGLQTLPTRLATALRSPVPRARFSRVHAQRECPRENTMRSASVPSVPIAAAARLPARNRSPSQIASGHRHRRCGR